MQPINKAQEEIIRDPKENLTTDVGTRLALLELTVYDRKRGNEALEDSIDEIAAFMKSIKRFIGLNKVLYSLIAVQFVVVTVDLAIRLLHIP